MLGITEYLYRLIPGNPILLRVVQAAGKRKRDLIIRCGYLGLLAGFVCLSVAGFGGSLTSLAQTSGILFKNLSYIQLGLVALLAPIFTAGAITQEQDAQTYDILLATPLTNGQIVLGSMLSRVFFIFALLLSGIPIFSITQVFGGVAIQSIVISFGISCATAMITGSLAVAIAAFKVGTRRTIFAFYLFILVFLVSGIFLDRVDAFHPIISQTVKTSTQAGAPPADEPVPQVDDKTPDRLTITTVRNTPLNVGDKSRYVSIETTTSRLRTSWFTGINPFLALRVLFNDPQYIPPQLGMLPPSLRAWPYGWYLSRPDGFYISFMFFLSFVLVIPSILLLRRIAQSTTTLRTRVLTILHLSKGNRTRKPRTVWSNPIAWREARTKASAARATFIRFTFIGAGLLGAIVLVIAASRMQEVNTYILPGSYNAAEHSLTVYNSLENSAITYDTSHAVSTLGHKEKPLDELAGKYQVFSMEKSKPGEKLANGADAGHLTAIDLEDLKPLLDPDKARFYLMGMVLLEFAGILLIVTNAAASTVTREKEDGTLDLLLSTPITSRYYIWGKLRGLVSFVLPLVAVPVISVLLFVAADMIKAVAGSKQPALIFPEVILVLPGTMIIVAALAAILGMQMSLRSRTTVWAVMSSVGIMAAICFGLGACGFGMLDGSGDMNGLALVASCFSPFTLLTVLLDPFERAKAAFPQGSTDIMTSRILTFIFGWIATGAYTMIVWAMYKSMVKNFDMTIRRQSR